MTRAVSWGGLHNTRDLGGMPRASHPPSTTPTGLIFRSGHLDALDAAGWAALVDAGVRTIIDLRNPSEIGELRERPAGVTTFRLPVEDDTDDDFMAEWGGRLGSPEYYGVAVTRWPTLFRLVFDAIATAPEGGVLIHCAAGRDRTGLVVALLLDAADVELSAVLADYEESVRLTNERRRTNPVPHEAAVDDVTLEARIAIARERLADFLDSVERDALSPELDRAAARLHGSGDARPFGISG